MKDPEASLRQAGFTVSPGGNEGRSQYLFSRCPAVSRKPLIIRIYPRFRTMKKFVLALALFTCLSIPACQCSDKPDIGPVEGQTQSELVASDLV